MLINYFIIENMYGEQLQTILATNLRRVRREFGYSQAKLAELAGISTGYMCDIENGRKWPGPDKFCTLAQVLKLEPYQLILPTEDSPYFDRYRTLTKYTQQLKLAITQSVDSAYDQIMGSYHAKEKESN